MGVVKTYSVADIKLVDAVLLNHSPYGVSYETFFNFTSTRKYLRRKTNHVSLLDTNNNVNIAADNLWEALVQL